MTFPKRANYGCSVSSGSECAGMIVPHEVILSAVESQGESSLEFLRVELPKVLTTAQFRDLFLRAEKYTRSVGGPESLVEAFQELRVDLDNSSTFEEFDKLITDIHDQAESKRKRLSTAATCVLKQWVDDHLDDPYPTEMEKQDLAKRTGLSLSQLGHWFINVRRRYVHPKLNTVQVYPNSLENRE